MHSFGSSGVRGVAFEELSPADVLAIAQAAGHTLGADRVAVARDTRLTGPALANAAASGLASVGADIERLGVVPTPGLQAHCERVGCPGVMVTASHNPPEYNGVKLVGADGVELTREVLDDVEAAMESSVSPVDWDAAGQSEDVEGARRRYREVVVDAVESEAIAAAELTVVIDSGHGAGSLTSPGIFRELGCGVRTINAQPDGRFPGRNPEPVAENLDELCQLVVASDADLGIAHDGDADRAIFVDETGEVIEGGAALAALAATSLSPDDVIVSAINASQRLVDVAQAAGADLDLTRIGSTYLISAIKAHRQAGRHVPIAGEGNGGIMFPDYRVARDGAYTAARFCELLVEATASEVVAPYDGYENVRRDVPYADAADRRAMLEALEAAAADAEATVDRTDGLRLDYGDAWVLARPSGTEPLIRIYAEARDADRAGDLANRIERRIHDAQ